MSKSEGRNYDWLLRITEDLNAEDFGSRELVQEFAALGGCGEESEVNTERDVRSDLRHLVRDGLVEKIAEGRYRISESGRRFMDERSTPSEE